MISSLKPYSEYQDTGLNWLGQVPRHWDISPIAGIARLKSIVNRPERQLLSVYLQRGVVRFSDVLQKRTNATSEDLSKYQAVDEGDFVLNNQQAWRGSVGVSDYSGIVSPAYLVLALSKRYLPRYANFLLRDQSMVSQYLVCSKGVGSIQRNLYWPHLKRVGVVIPPPDEQAAIVRFLDWANGRLERTIRAKQKVITLLNEQKHGIIHRAVTRGLDTGVPLRPSGIPWIGDIPAHWEARKIRTIARLIVSNVDKHSRQNEIDVRLCNYVDVYKNDKIDECISFMPATASVDEIERFRIRLGDVILTKDSEAWDDIGVPSFVAYEADDLVCGYHLAILRTRSEMLSGSFLHRVLEDPFVAAQMHIRAKGVTRYGLGHAAIKEVLLPIPPDHEQRHICRRLEMDLAKFVAAKKRLECEIGFIREYRARLITDVVTGKLDVRDAVLPLPDNELQAEGMDGALEDAEDNFHEYEEADA
jgi:type I restriction enzyme S subunit